MDKFQMEGFFRQLTRLWEDDPLALRSIEYLRGKLKESNSFQEESFDRKKNGMNYPFPYLVPDEQIHFALFSDGACRGNPGPGSWGAIAQAADGELIFETSGIDMLTTNNRMELAGSIAALLNIEQYLSEQNIPLKTPNLFISLYSDSKYVVDGISKWVPGWKRKGWKKADGQTPENLAQWQELEEIAARFPRLKFYWVKGHSGHPQNERCDQLANEALDNAGL